MNTLDEKVHRIGGPAEKRGAPTDKARAFDKVNARTGARKNRSVLKALEKAKPEQEYFALDVSEDPDYTMVLVMKAGLYDHDYYGVNVLFYPDGRIEASTGDSLADKQWASNKREIIKVAKKQLKTGAPMGDTDADVRAYHGAGDGDYSGYKDKKMNEVVRARSLDLSKKPGEQVKDPESQEERDELAGTVRGNRSRMRSASSRDVHPNLRRGAASGQTNHSVNSRFVSGQDAKQASVRNEGMVTFKQFLLAEVKKVKEPGWYVCDHMDKPVSGPMQERGAKEEAEEKNAAHAAKHGKGDIPPFSAEYFSDYEIKRMNEGFGDEPDLTRSQKKALLKDFEGWSGGFTPDDCTAAQVREYLTHGLSKKLPHGPSKKYLEYIRNNGASNAP